MHGARPPFQDKAEQNAMLYTKNCLSEETNVKILPLRRSFQICVRETTAPPLSSRLNSAAIRTSSTPKRYTQSLKQNELDRLRAGLWVRRMFPTSMSHAFDFSFLTFFPFDFDWRLTLCFKCLWSYLCILLYGFLRWSIYVYGCGVLLGLVVVHRGPKRCVDFRKLIVMQLESDDSMDHGKATEESEQR